MATTMAPGPLVELVAPHIEPGIFNALDVVLVARERNGSADALLLRTLAALPSLPEAGLDSAATLSFPAPAILLRIGWAPARIQAEDNQRHRHPEGRQAEPLPCHPDTLRDELRRVEAAAWLEAQNGGVAALYGRQCVRGEVHARDGSGLGNDSRPVCLACVSGARPPIAARRPAEGAPRREVARPT